MDDQGLTGYLIFCVGLIGLYATYIKDKLRE